MKDLFHGQYPLKSGRAHEVTGPGAAAFAAIACGLETQRDGRPVMWLIENWRVDLIHPAGLSPFCAPHRLLLGRVPDQKTMLASAEEALRSGAVTAVVAEVPRALSFTAGRRLQLAAEEGRSVGILIIGEGMGNNAAESRWHCAPLFSPKIPRKGSIVPAPSFADSTLQRWRLIKNKTGTMGYWDIIWDAETRRVIVVSEAGERPYSAALDGDDAVCPDVAAE